MNSERKPDRKRQASAEFYGITQSNFGEIEMAYRYLISSQKGIQDAMIFYVI